MNFFNSKVTDLGRGRSEWLSLEFATQLEKSRKKNC